MTAAYSIAAIPEPFQILGLGLKPLSLGRFILMERFDVAFVSDYSKDPELADLVLGVLICSQTHESFLKLIESNGLEKAVTDWGSKASLFDFAEKAKLFYEYLEVGLKQPVVFFKNDAEPSGAHWAQVLKLVLMEAGYTESQALNMALTKAFADFYKNAETKGALTIATDAEVRAIEAMKKPAEAAWP